MEHGSAATRAVRPIDLALLAAGAQTAAAAIRDGDGPARAIEAAVDAFYDAVAGVMPSVFVLEHGRLIRLDGPSIRTLHLKLDDALKDESDQDDEVARISGAHI